MNYEIKVIGLVTDSHPHGELFTSLDAASARFKELKVKYLYNDIVLYELTRKELIRSPAQTKPSKPSKPPKCPWKHEGKALDGRPVMRETRPGTWMCVLCGYHVNLEKGSE